MVSHSKHIEIDRSYYFMGASANRFIMPKHKEVLVLKFPKMISALKFGNIFTSV